MKNRYFVSSCLVLLTINLAIFSTCIEPLSDALESVSTQQNATTNGYSIADTTFDRVIGLGHRCTTYRQIKRYFSPDRHGKKRQEDLFNNLAIYDYDLFAAALRCNLDDFFERGDFDLIIHNELYTLFNRKYNMYWSHLFDGLAGAELNLKKNQMSFTDETVDLFYPIIKEQKNFLRERFIAAKDHTTLYVIATAPPCEDPSLETLLRVRDALIQIRDGNKEFFYCLFPLTKRTVT